MSNDFHKPTVLKPTKQGIHSQQHLWTVSNCKFGAMALISKVGSDASSHKLSVIGHFGELLTDFSGQ